MRSVKSSSRAICWIIDVCGDGEGVNGTAFRGIFIFVGYTTKQP